MGGKGGGRRSLLLLMRKIYIFFSMWPLIIVLSPSGL